MLWVNTQSIDDKLSRATERVLKQIPPRSLQPAGEGCRAEGNLGQEPGSLYSRPASGPDFLGHCLLVMSPSASLLPHLYQKKKKGKERVHPTPPNWVMKKINWEMNMLSRQKKHKLFLKLITFYSFLCHTTPQQALYRIDSHWCLLSSCCALDTCKLHFA